MKQFCDWLYLNYAAPRFDEESMPESYRYQKEEWMACAQTLSNHERLLSLDLLNNMKHSWGARAFAYGLQAGLMMSLELFSGGPTSPEAR